MTRKQRYRMRFDWRPYIFSDGRTIKGTRWRDVFDLDGKRLGHVVPYRLGRGWNAYRVDGERSMVLPNKSAVEAFFAEPLLKPGDLTAKGRAELEKIFGTRVDRIPKAGGAR